MIKRSSLAIFISALLLTLPLAGPAAISARQQKPRRGSGEHCLNLAFNAIQERAEEKSRFVLALDARQDCRECRIDQARAMIAMTRAVCKFTTAFQPAAESNESRIEINQRLRQVTLTGEDEAEMRELFSSQCELGGIPVAIGEAIEVVYDENEMVLELENGRVRRYKGPVPIWAHAMVKDSCQNQARSIIEVNPK